jgi:hypothetical protein
VWNHQTYQQLFSVTKANEYFNGVCYGAHENMLCVSAVYGINIWDIASNSLLVDIYTYTRIGKGLRWALDCSVVYTVC